MSQMAAVGRETSDLRVEAALETALVVRAQAGDSDAFHSLVAVRLVPTFRLAKAILGTVEEAEDATQEAFLAAWRGLASLRDPGRFDAWFGRIVANACRMSVRRRPRAILMSVDLLGELPTDDGDHPLSAVAAADALQRAIDRLSVAHRTVLALHHLQDRPVAEVGAILRIPIGTVKWRLHQARGALERAVEAED